jgi:hypothetical protein
MKAKVLLFSILAVFLVSGIAAAYDINDYTGNAVPTSGEGYIGAWPYNTQLGDTSTAKWGFDVIGNTDHFEIFGMNVTLGATSMTVDIYSEYFDAASMGNGRTFMGDLFISTDGWSPNTDTTNPPAGFGPSGPYPETSYDYYVNGEDWEYVAVLGDSLRPDADSPVPQGEIYVYAVDPNYIEMSRAGGFKYFRDLQELYYDVPEGAISVASGTYTWGNDLLSINITDWEQAFDNLGFHWTMSCGNDVIEGRVSEPATMLLLGFGLIGLTVVGRKRFVK